MLSEVCASRVENVMSFEFFMIVALWVTPQCVCSGVSEEHAASILMVEV
jgi:hypothetical protein